MTRRAVLRTAGGIVGASLSAAAYGLWIEPAWRLRVAEYRVTPRRWPTGLRLRIAVVADLHAGEPHMPISRVADIVERTNALKPDLILLLGDYRADHAYVSRRIAPAETVPALAGLTAPLGCLAIFGNHEYWYDVTEFRAAFAAAAIPVLENAVAPIATPAGPVFVAGTASTIAIRLSRWRYAGLDDLPGTLAKVPDGAPVILAAHEPDLFVAVPARVAVTLSGHTHGGQVRLFGHSPHVPSAYGNRFAYGHVVEDGRHLVVSGGLGLSVLPVRIGVPPEITLVTLG